MKATIRHLRTQTPMNDKNKGASEPGHQVLAELHPPRIATPRGMISPSKRVIPPKLRTFAMTDSDVLSWRSGGK
jgi:hypothetical protein